MGYCLLLHLLDCNENLSAEKINPIIKIKVELLMKISYNLNSKTEIPDFQIKT